MRTIVARTTAVANQLGRPRARAELVMLAGFIVVVAVTIIVCLAFINSNRVWIKYHPDHDKSPLDQIGPFIGGVSLFFAAISAWLTAFLITWRNARLQRYMSAVDSFRALYDAFWTPPDVAFVRRCIISSDEYGKVLQPVLEIRNRTEFNELCSAQNETLERLDKFLSVLVRIKSFSVSKEWDYIIREQRKLLRKVIHGAFWVKYAYNRRPELWLYIFDHWPELLPPNAPRIPDSTRELKWADFQ